MENNLIEINAPIGVMYLEKNEEDNNVLYALLDSSKNFIVNIYNEDTIDEIKKCNHPQELFEAVLYEGICFAQSLEDLVDEINKVIEEKNEEFGYDDSLLSLEDLENNDYYNQIGNWHIFMME